MTDRSNSSPPVYRHRILDSTNSEAIRLAEQGAPHHTAVVAKFQTAGRGQPGRQWWMPENAGVLLSVLLRSLPQGAAFDQLTLRVGWEMAQALKQFAGVAIGIKEPNDLMIEGKKVGGILCEARWREDQLLYAVIGVGVNVNVLEFPDELRPTATSLALVAGKSFDPDALADFLIQTLRKM